MVIPSPSNVIMELPAAKSAQKIAKLFPGLLHSVGMVLWRRGLRAVTTAIPSPKSASMV